MDAFRCRKAKFLICLACMGECRLDKFLTLSKAQFIGSGGDQGRVRRGRCCYGWSACGRDAIGAASRYAHVIVVVHCGCPCVAAAYEKEEGT